MIDRPRNTVSVLIGGEEYKIRSDATPEYTQECAALVDRALTEVLRQGSLIEGHKAAILAALSITDQLLQARAELDLVRGDVGRLAAKLAGDIQMALVAEDLAAGS